jgi:Polysaccharide deacetylase
VSAPVICLTFDTDHIDEPAMERFLAVHPVPGDATFFCTQSYAALADTRHELAPHPTLDAGGDWRSELAAGRRQFPAAVSWRSHSCVFSHRIAEWLQQNGYRYVSVFDEIGSPGLRPNRLPWGVWHLPIYYMDSLDLGRTRLQPGGGDHLFDEGLLEQATSVEGLYVFDFHPIHLLFNTPSVEFYTAARSDLRTGTELARLRHPGRGAADFFATLCDRMRQCGLASIRISEVVDRLSP